MAIRWVKRAEITGLRCGGIGVVLTGDPRIMPGDKIEWAGKWWTVRETANNGNIIRAED